MTAEKQSFLRRRGLDREAAKFHYNTPRHFLSRVILHKFESLFFLIFVHFTT